MYYMRAFIILSLLFATGCAARSQEVKIITGAGDIVVQLAPDKAPKTVSNFLKYVEKGYYRGGSFFRTVTPGNQPDSPVKIEVIQADVHPWKQNFLFDPVPLERTSVTGLHHKNGTISMARDTPDSAQGSFFICVGDQPALDYGGNRNPDGQGFAAFGQVIAGMAVVRKIQQAPQEGQALVPPVLINDVVVLP